MQKNLLRSVRDESGVEDAVRYDQAVRTAGNIVQHPAEGTRNLTRQGIIARDRYGRMPCQKATVILRSCLDIDVGDIDLRR